MGLEQIGLQAILDDKNFQAGLSRYTAGLGQMTKLTDGAAKAIGGAFKIATGALLVGVGGIAAVLATSVKAAAEAEQVSAQVDAVLKSTGGVAGVTREAVDGLATSLSEMTPFEDDAIAAGEAMLLTFTNIGKNVFPLVTETMLDMSQAMGQDLKSSALQLGKALQDPSEGLSALSRVGVKFTKEQEAMVKQLVAAGKTEQAQRVILKELQTEFGGAAKAAGQTFAGQLKILQNTLGNVQEEIGGALLPVLTRMAGSLVKMLNDPRVKSGLKFLTNAFEDLFDLLEGGDTAWDALQDDLVEIGKLFGIGEKQSRGFFRQLSNFSKWINQNLTPAIDRLWLSFQRGGFGGLFDQLVNEIQRAAPAIQQQLATWGAQFWNWLTGPDGAIARAGAKIGEFAGKLGAALQANWPTISAQFSAWSSQFWNWLTGKGGAIEQVAAEVFKIASSLASWLATNWDSTIAPALRGWVGAFWGWITDANGGLLVTVAANMAKLTAAIRAWTELATTRDALRNIGRDIAQMILDGIGSLFSDQRRGDNLIMTLLNNLRTAVANSRQMLYNIVYDLAYGFWSELLRRFTDPVNASNLASAIGNAMASAVDIVLLGIPGLIGRIVDYWNSLVSQIRLNFPSISLPGAPAPSNNPGYPYTQYATGGWVPRTQMALVHRGEYIIPARQAQSIVNNSRVIGPGAVVINFPSTGGLSRETIRNTVYQTMTEVLGAA